MLWWDLSASVPVATRKKTRVKDFRGGGHSNEYALNFIEVVELVNKIC